MDSIRSASFGKVFRPDNFIYGKSGLINAKSLRSVNRELT